MKKFLMFFALVSLLFIPATGCYAKGPWKGKVIDAETKKPIEGVAVVAVWYKEWAGLGAGAITQFLDAAETTTDKNGDFEIPAKSFLSIPYFRKVKGPEFTMFKPGYGSYPEYQVNIKAPNLTAMEYFQTKEAIVELPKLTNKTRKELKYLPSVSVEPKYRYKIKNFFKILDAEIQNINREENEK